MSKTVKIILNLVHLVCYAYNIEYHDKVVLNLHASNMNASIFLHITPKDGDLHGAMKMRF